VYVKTKEKDRKMKKLVVYVLMVSSLYAQNIKSLQYAGVTTEHERFDGTMEKFTVEREVDRLCIFIPISNESVWEGEYAGRDIPQRCINTFVKGIGQIQPMTIHPDVETIGELEVLEFIEKMKHNHNMLLIDTRDESFYNYRTIPSATNIFYRHITKRATFPEEFDKIVKSLGVVKIKDSYDFTNAKIISTDFHCIDFTKLKLKETGLILCNLTECNFNAMHIAGCDFTDSDFSKANLRDACLDKCILEQSKFFQADLTNASLCNARCNTANFSKAVLNGANCKNAEMPCACFVNASLKNADFSMCILDRAEFNYADCSGGLFIKSRLRYADMSHAKFIACDMSESILLQARLHCCDDTAANWKGASKVLVETTDKDLALAEAWKPPRP